MRAFGEQLKSVKSEACYSAAFWKEKLNGINDEHTWDYVITLYLAYWCTDEERKFINDVFFKQNSAKLLSMRLFMSETAFYLKKEQILNCLLAFAMQEGIITIDLENKRFEEIACTGDTLIDDAVWHRIKVIIIRKVNRVTSSMRVSVEAMFYVVIHNISWRDMPVRFGPWKTVYNKYLRWKKIGLWDEIYGIMSTII